MATSLSEQQKEGARNIQSDMRSYALLLYQIWKFKPEVTTIK